MPGRPPKPAAQIAFEKAIGARIAARRNSLGVSQTEMAEKLRMPEDAYKKWEQRGAIPTYYLTRLSIDLEIDPWQLLTGYPSFLKSIDGIKQGKLHPFPPASTKAVTVRTINPKKPATKTS